MEQSFTYFDDELHENQIDWYRVEDNFVIPYSFHLFIKYPSCTQTPAHLKHILLGKTTQYPKQWTHINSYLHRSLVIPMKRKQRVFAPLINAPFLSHGWIWIVIALYYPFHPLPNIMDVSRVLFYLGDMYGKVASSMNFKCVNNCL